MSIDYYNCSICGIIFNDCGEYGYCSNCGEIMCGDCRDEQVEKYGNPEEGSEAAEFYGIHSPAECDRCSNGIIRDEEIIQWFVNMTHITKEHVINEIKKNKSR